MSSVGLFDPLPAPPAATTALAQVLAGRAYVRQKDVARAFSVDPSTIRAWSKSNRLGFPPPITLPAEGVFYPVPEVLAFEAELLSMPRTIAQQLARNAEHMEKRRLRKGARARDARREVDAAERRMLEAGL